MRISDWSSDVCSSDLNRIVEAAGRIFGQIGVRVALYDGKALGDGLGHIDAIKLYSARVDPFLVAQRRHQRAVAATDNKHARAFGHIGDRKSTRLNSSH